jgi:hypothetical protein
MRLWSGTLAPLAGALLAGCATTIVTPYDSVLDSRVTDLHAKIETFLDTMDLAGATAEVTYRTNWHFYVECVSEAQILRRRATAGMRDDVAHSLGEIAVTVEGLRRAHETGGTLDRALIQQIRPVLREAFDAIYRRQSSLRGGL